MARVTMIIGFVLVAVGIAFWGITGRVAPTALIPCYFGIALMICGARARTEDLKRRMLYMHVAVIIGLLGFVFPGIRGGMALAKKHATGMDVMAPRAVEEQLLMAIICLVFTAMCIRSFIAARRTPPEAEVVA
jgi:hypothetical protein